jgi:hypothetical protein
MRPLQQEPDYLYGLALADMHVFSAFGLAPPDFENSAGNKIQLNRGQSYLLECWIDMLQRRIPKTIDVLFLVGDIVEGQNPAEHARLLSEVDDTFQVRGAHELLIPIVSRVKRNKKGRRNIYMVSGSRYHVGRGYGYEQQLGAFLDSVKRSNFYAPPWRKLMFGGVYFDVGHHQSFTIRYSSMPLERELEFLMTRMGKKRKALPRDVVIMRAHTHKGYRVWRENGALCISLPCWKLQDFFAASSKTPNRLIPDNLGAVGLKVYREPFNGEIVHPVKILYEHPEEEVENVDAQW